MLWHLFHQIYQVFHHNEEVDNDSKDPISLKKVGQGYGIFTVIVYLLILLEYLVDMME